ncbi:MAG: acetyl-CoA carboxylase, carboxyltransferase subunit beta [Firmicutes bacterium]|jgi:acetyl-CoA carboxylase carboxyl transferase subunit beta|nr:acetyl-CoA carboxylase, carboxyltransferase subunit beta [Bacillota bacterium]
MNPFRERKNILDAIGRVTRLTFSSDEKASEVMKTCPGCGQKYDSNEWAHADYVCPSCGAYISMTAAERIRKIADEGTFREFNRGRTGYDPIDFPGYEEKIQKMRKDTGLKEAVVTGSCQIGGEKAVLCVMDKRFMMASMGTAVGEKVFLAFEYAVKKKLPIVIFTASGGARMQEGIMALMQMARTSAAAARHDEAGLLYIAVMTDPTTGGVTASFASLADITLAEKGALIGFAGQRVIEQTIGEELPEGFQRADFQREKGFVDMVVERQDMKTVLARLLYMHGRGRSY